MAGQGFIPNDPQTLRHRDGPGGGDAPQSVEDARDVIHGRKTVEEALKGGKQPSDAPLDGGPMGRTKVDR